MKIAVSFEIKAGKIVLFDENGKVVKGKGVHFEGNFYCSNNGLTSLEGAPESVGGGFYCGYNKLTSLEGAPESVGGDFYCSNNSLTSLEGAPESVGGDFYCSNNSLTSLEGAPESVGGDFYCSNNSLTSLEGAPESVGGGFYCGYNKLTSLEGAPKETQQMFGHFLERGYLLADGILTRLVSKRKRGKYTIYKTEKLGYKKNAPIVYVAHDGEDFAHGKSIKEAVFELAFKTGDRDVSEFKDMALDAKKTPEEWAIVYRMITGACQYGTEQFMKSRKLKKTYTLAEIIKETGGAYGGERFKGFFGN